MSNVQEASDMQGGWDELMAAGRQHEQKADWELALRAYNTALSLNAESSASPSQGSRHRRLLKELAYVNRCMGRYVQAQDLLEELLPQLGSSDPLRLKVTGELGVIYRQLNHLEAARDAFDAQYALATELRDQQRLCRAIGNLGMINYQLSQRAGGDERLLELATVQLQERVERAQDLRNAVSADPSMLGKYDYASTLKAIGLSRLSLCHSARGENERAVATALEALELAERVMDSAVEAISRFFYGRALLRAGQREAALEQFDLPKSCSPAVAFCKEPSAEHCEYLQELLNAGANMDTPDDHGYDALDYAVFNGNKVAEGIILKFLEVKAGGESTSDAHQYLDKRLEESKLRKSYREIFQEKMRPILLGANENSLHLVRKMYAKAIDTDDDVKRAFDRMRYVRYKDFISFGRFPRSSDDLTQQLHADSEDTATQHIVFISYRWVNRDPWARYPDNAENRQYGRIREAIDAYLAMHAAVDPEHLDIWIDFACIDQDDPMPGIRALPFLIAQCNALISLVDEEYHGRAWCSVEVMMIQALRKAYHLHLWYEHVRDPRETGESARMILRPGSEALEPEPSRKKLRFQSDMERVLFLERQCRLLC